MRIVLTFNTDDDGTWGFDQLWKDKKDTEAIRKLIRENAFEFVSGCRVHVDDYQE